MTAASTKSADSLLKAILKNAEASAAFDRLDRAHQGVVSGACSSLGKAKNLKDDAAIASTKASVEALIFIIPAVEVDGTEVEAAKTVNAGLVIWPVLEAAAGV